jgi:cytochrome c oxidase subunit 2
MSTPIAEAATTAATTVATTPLPPVHPAELVNAVNLVDQTFLLIFGISAALLVLLTAAMIWFVFRYNRKRHPVPSQVSGNFWAEFIWIVVPTLLVLGMFWSGWHSYRALRDAPADALEIKVMARMWSWDFEYPNGKHSGTLVVPVGKAIKLQLNSADVLHGFFAPAFRIKIDTVPGMPTYGWFRAEKEGEYVIFCSVYCGLQHAKMISAIRAVSAEEYEKFLNEKAASGHPGKALLDAKGCLGCHSLDGSAGVGPTLRGVFGREVVLVAPDKKEKKLKYDAKALTMMIMGPRAGVVKGFEPMMPEYKDQVTADELKQILDFLEHGEKAADGPEAGHAVAEAQGCLGCHSVDGAEIAGPTFKGLFGKKGLAKDGAVVDRPYVDAILKDPASRLGKPSSMPAYPALTETEREALMKFLESVGTAPPPTPAIPAGAPMQHEGHEGKPAGKAADKGHAEHQ